jgi:hypothetical protein
MRIIHGFVLPKNGQSRRTQAAVKGLMQVKADWRGRATLTLED